MKYLKIFDLFKEGISPEIENDIRGTCNYYNIRNYTVYPDGTVDVYGNVSFFNDGLKKIPITFNKVNGWFNCSKNKLTSLEGCPVEANGSFYCSINKLTSLEGCPKKMNGFDCSFNEITSLKESPVEINGDFLCNNNRLVSLEGCPKIVRGKFSCLNNNIKSFEYFPSYIKEHIDCYNNPIYEIWVLFADITKIELLNDFDIFRDEDTDTPSIIMDRLNDFLLTIGEKEVKSVDQYKNI